MEINPIEIANNQVDPIQEITLSLQAKSPNNPSNKESQDFLKFLNGSDNLAGGTGIQPKKQKLSMVDQVSIEETHNLASDGDWITKYPTYKLGRDNAEFAAQNQTSWDKWANGLTKAGANFGATVAGNTVGLVYGAANGISEGSWNAVFDNNFSNALADWNEKLGYQLPNYVKKDMQGAGFLDSLTGDTANFLANDVMGAFSFTLGTVVSEAIWAVATGGAGNIAKAGLRGVRWSKDALSVGGAIRGISNSKGMLDDFARNVYKTTSTKGLQEAGIASATRAKWLNNTRFLATTSGNEAGIEALHFKREARENFYDNFAKLNGREPSEKDITEFETNIESASNGVFLANMAILAPSNAIMFGKMFNISSPFKGITKSIDKSVFGVGVEKTIEGAFKGVQASKSQIGARWAYSLGKGTVTEGLFEEGLQGVSSKSAENWIASTYNPKYNNDSMSLIDATYKAFNEQYSTKQGWKEIGIGGIVGTGMSLIQGGGLPSEIKEFQEKQKYQDEFIAKGFNQFGDGSSTATALIAQKMMMDARVKSSVEKQKQAFKDGDDVGAMLANQEPLIAEMQFRKAIGEDTKSLVKKYETALNATPKEVWEQEGITDIENYKQSVLNGYSNLIDSFERANKFADAVIGDSSLIGGVRIDGQRVANQQLKDALTYSIVSGQTANRAMDTTLLDFSKILGEDSVKALSVQREFERLGKNKQSQIRKVNSDITQADNEVKSLSNELLKLQASKDEEKGEKLQKVQAKLIESSERLEKLRQEREVFAQEVSQESKRRKSIETNSLEDFNLTQDFITGEDLQDIDAKLSRIEDTIKNYKGNNHELYYELLDLQKQYKSAKSKFMDYQEAIDAIVSGKFQPKFAKVEGFLGKVFNAGVKPMDDFTTEFLENVYNKYRDTIGEVGVNQMTQTQFVSDEEYAKFKETEEVSEELKKAIVQKVQVKEILDQREKEIYNTISQEVNQILKPNPNKPNLEITPIVKEEVLTDVQRLKKQIEQTFDESYPLLTTDVEELIKDKPSKQEVERYLELYKQKEKFDLFLQREFEELQPRMQKWFMAQSLPLMVGKSIADVVEIIAQLETQVQKDDTVTEFETEELFIDSSDARDLERTDVLVNVSGSAVAKIKDNKIYLAHVKVKNILDKLIQNGASVMEIQTVSKDGKLYKSKPLTNELLNKNVDKVGTVFQIGEVKLTIGERGNVIFNLDEFNKIASDILNMYYFDAKAGKWSYIDLYTEIDGKKIKMLSEYETNTNSDAIYNVEKGDSLELFVDMDLEWNYNLKVKALEEVNENGEISEDTKKEIFNSLNITSKKDRVNNSTLKGTKVEEVNDKFLLIRKRFADKFIEVIETEQSLTGLPKKLELDIEVPVENIYLGTPEFVLNAQNKPMDIPITPRGIQEVVTQGYVQGSEMVVADKKIDIDKISRLYVTNLVKQNPSNKIPVVILKKGIHTFAFPISLVKTVENQAEKLEDILSKNLPVVEEIKEVNNLLISLGSPTRVSGISEVDVDSIKSELEQYTTFISADELASSQYDKNNLISDATIKIDLEDKLISSPKIAVDFSKAMIGRIEENENNAVKLREDIVKDIVEIRNIVNSTPDISEDSRFVQAFDNEDVENKGTDIMNRKDVNFIKKTFFYSNGNRIPIQGKTVDIIGKDRLVKLRDKIEMLQFYEDQIKIAQSKKVELAKIEKEKTC